ALDKVDMSGMQWVELTEYDTDRFLLPGNSSPKNGATPPAFARWGFLIFGIQ
ncbi:hypothetical protein HMPREF0971_03381, partial [Segatella oris F0302]